MVLKSSVRNNILSQLNSLSREDKSRASSAIQIKLKDLLKNKSGSWGAFKNLKDEPEINWYEVSSDINWAFPKLTSNGSMEFRKSVTEFKKSTLGFSEPADGETIAVEQLNGFVIPALAYDRKGYRLGRGKGFYDRALKGYQGSKIGVCFNVSLCEELPREEHDIKCEQVVTDQQTFKVN